MNTAKVIAAVIVGAATALAGALTEELTTKSFKK